MIVTGFCQLQIQDQKGTKIMLEVTTNKESFDTHTAGSSIPRNQF